MATETPAPAQPKHFFSVGAVFKNEAHALKEWLEHYIREGADHFYLVDDSSTDNSVEILAPYIERGLVTLYQPTWHRYLGRQRAMYNNFFLPVLKESQWFLVVDLDEFVWSPACKDLPHLLRQIPHLAQIQVSVTIFGSNGHVKQPPSMIAGFTRRSRDIVTKEPACLKYFVNSSYEFESLNVHHATFKDESLELTRFQLLGPTFLRLNHYSCQSREVWEKVKTTRGDCDEYLTRTEDHWNLADQNDVEDTGLLERMRKMIASG